MDSTESSHVSLPEASPTAGESMERPTYIKFVVSNAEAASVIGEGGKTITDFQTQSGARISLSSDLEFFPEKTGRILMIFGNVNEIIMAMDLILGKIRSEIQIEEENQVDPLKKVILVIPNSCCGGMNGKGGFTIKSFMEESLAHIKISPEENDDHGLNERLVTVTGTLEAQMRAIHLILSNLAEDPHYARYIDAQFSNPATKDVTGGKFMNNKKMAFMMMRDQSVAIKLKLHLLIDSLIYEANSVEDLMKIGDKFSEPIKIINSFVKSMNDIINMDTETNSDAPALTAPTEVEEKDKEKEEESKDEGKEKDKDGEEKDKEKEEEENEKKNKKKKKKKKEKAKDVDVGVLNESEKQAYAIAKRFARLFVEGILLCSFALGKNEADICFGKLKQSLSKGNDKLRLLQSICKFVESKKSPVVKFVTMNEEKNRKSGDVPAYVINFFAEFLEGLSYFEKYLNHGEEKGNDCISQCIEVLTKSEEIIKNQLEGKTFKFWHEEFKRSSLDEIQKLFGVDEN